MRRLLRRLTLICLSVWAISAFLHHIHNFPQIQNDFLKDKVGSKVVYVADAHGGGTGFFVKAPSGKTYIVTNAHICDMHWKEGVVNVMFEDGRSIKRKIIAESPMTDLCLVESIPGIEGLEMADSVNLHQIVYAVGHPELQPLTITQGETVAVIVEAVLLGEIKDDADLQHCQSPKNEVIEAATSKIAKFFHAIIHSTKATTKLCLENVKAMRTTVPIVGGSSGSPMVNSKGQVVGVMFAGDRSTNWGSAVVLEDLKSFLKGR